MPQSPRTALPFFGQLAAAHSKVRARHAGTRPVGVATTLLASGLAEHLGVDDRCSRLRRAAAERNAAILSTMPKQERRSGRRLSALTGGVRG